MSRRIAGGSPFVSRLRHHHAAGPSPSASSARRVTTVRPRAASSSDAMPAFTLYGARASSNTDRVRLTLAEMGFTDYETVLLDLRKGEQKSPENMRRHPWGKVPVVTFADGLVLYESRAICQYLARTHGWPLLPTDTVGEALFAQAQSVELAYFAEPAGRISFERVGKKYLGLPPDEAVIAAALRAVHAFCNVADTLLQKHRYMAGDAFTLVDIYYIPLVRRLFACGYGDDTFLRRPALRAWWERVTSRPGIQSMLAADKDANDKIVEALAADRS